MWLFDRVSRTKRHISRAVSNAKLKLHPFPHLIVDRIFPERLIRELLQNWPHESCLSPEGDGSFHRMWAHLIASNTDASPALSSANPELWSEFTRKYATEWVGALFEKFSPIFRERAGYRINEYNIGQLVCFESGPEFTHFPNHTH